MADEIKVEKPEAVNAALGEMKLEEEDEAHNHVNGTNGDMSTPRESKRSQSNSPGLVKSGSQTPITKNSASQTPKSEDDEEEELIGGDITVTAEPGKAPKLTRKSSQKVISRPPPLFSDLPDATEEASSVFQVIKDCIYGAKHMGASEHDALDCDCAEEWSMLVFLFSRASCWLTMGSRRWQELCLWGGFRLHQSTHENGMWRRS
jgi:hypothetical protein